MLENKLIMERNQMDLEDLLKSSDDKPSSSSPIAQLIKKEAQEIQVMKSLNKPIRENTESKIAEVESSDKLLEQKSSGIDISEKTLTDEYKFEGKKLDTNNSINYNQNVAPYNCQLNPDAKEFIPDFNVKPKPKLNEKTYEWSLQNGYPNHMNEKLIKPSMNLEHIQAKQREINNKFNYHRELEVYNLNKIKYGRMDPYRHYFQEKFFSKQFSNYYWDRERNYGDSIGLRSNKPDLLSVLGPIAERHNSEMMGEEKPSPANQINRPYILNHINSMQFDIKDKPVDNSTKDSKPDKKKKQNKKGDDKKEKELVNKQEDEIVNKQEDEIVNKREKEIINVTENSVMITKDEISSDSDSVDLSAKSVSLDSDNETKNIEELKSDVVESSSEELNKKDEKVYKKVQSKSTIVVVPVKPATMTAKVIKGISGGTKPQKKINEARKVVSKNPIDLKNKVPMKMKPKAVTNKLPTTNTTDPVKAFSIRSASVVSSNKSVDKKTTPSNTTAVSSPPKRTQSTLSRNFKEPVKNNLSLTSTKNNTDRPQKSFSARPPPRRFSTTGSSKGDNITDKTQQKSATARGATSKTKLPPKKGVYAFGSTESAKQPCIMWF